MTTIPFDKGRWTMATEPVWQGERRASVGVIAYSFFASLLLTAAPFAWLFPDSGMGNRGLVWLTVGAVSLLMSLGQVIWTVLYLLHAFSKAPDTVKLYHLPGHAVLSDGDDGEVEFFFDDVIQVRVVNLGLGLDSHVITRDGRRTRLLLQHRTRGSLTKHEVREAASAIFTLCSRNRSDPPGAAGKMSLR